MKGLEIKTTLYDIFGYLLPGGSALLLILMETYRISGIDSPLRYSLEKIGGLNFAQGIFLLGLSYIVGHGLSTLSRLILEDWFLEKCLAKHITDDNTLGTAVFKQFEERFKETFKYAYDKKSFRAVLAFVEERRIAIHGTAFIFLAFYGMARNLSMVALIGTIWYIGACFIFGIGMVPLAGVTFSAAIIFYYEYFRFHRYFHQHIMMGFLVKD
jgi:hypothetical protein